MRALPLLLALLLNSATAGGGGTGPVTATDIRTTRYEVTAVDSKGRALWTRAFPKALIADAGRVRQNVVVLTETGTPQFGTQRLTITLLSGVTGQTVWERSIDGRLHMEQSWDVVDDALWVTHSSGGEHWTEDNFGFRLQNGQPLWETSATGNPQAAAKGRVLFLRPTKAGIPNDPAHLSLQVVNTSTCQSRVVNLKIAQRPGCGLLDDTFVLENFAMQADAQFLWAQRHDQCGYFVTRYDWHRSEQQRPVTRSGTLP